MPSGRKLYQQIYLLRFRQMGSASRNRNQLYPRSSGTPREKGLVQLIRIRKKGRGFSWRGKSRIATVLSNTSSPYATHDGEARESFDYPKHDWIGDYGGPNLRLSQLRAAAKKKGNRLRVGRISRTQCSEVA